MHKISFIFFLWLAFLNFFFHFVSFFWAILLSLAFAFQIVTTNPYAFMGLGGRVLRKSTNVIGIGNWPLQTVKKKKHWTTTRRNDVRIRSGYLPNTFLTCKIYIFFVFIELSPVLDVKLKSGYLFCFYSRKTSGVYTISNMFWVFIHLISETMSL